MRSVWSRVGAGSITRVVPAAYSPASSTQDLTCALATGMWYSMPCSARPPRSTSGGRPSAAVSISAPIRRSGSATRAIGRRVSDSSPVRQTSKGCAASRPASSRIEVPELPR